MADNTRSDQDGGLVKVDAHTAFVLGNGPSLRGVSLPALSPYTTIGLNAAYRYWREIDWRPTYYACLDLVVGVSHAAAIGELIAEGRIEKFLLRGNLIDELGERASDWRVVNFDALKTRLDILQPPIITTGSHAALWAASMGYQRIALLGIDGQYKEIIAGAERRGGIELEIVREGENPNYFFEGYQQPGDRYNIPNPRPGLHVEAWRGAGVLLNKAGVAVYNTNPVSAVRCFPFIGLPAFLGDGAQRLPAEEEIRQTPALLETAPAAPARAGGAKRLAGFLRANLLACLAPGVIIAAALAILFAQEASKGAVLSFLFASGLFWTLVLALLYTRHAVKLHLCALQQEMDGLRARVSDAERVR